MSSTERRRGPWEVRPALPLPEQPPEDTLQAVAERLKAQGHPSAGLIIGPTDRPYLTGTLVIDVDAVGEAAERGIAVLREAGLAAGLSPEEGAEVVVVPSWREGSAF